MTLMGGGNSLLDTTERIEKQMKAMKKEMDF